MHAEFLREFTRKFELSRRETQIFGLITEGVISLKELAHHLSLSPSTINKHLNNIYEKTKTHGKAELLSQFVQFCSEKNQCIEPFIRAPRVLIVDDEIEICEILGASLSDRKVEVFHTTNPLEVKNLILENDIDIVLSDIRMPVMDGFEMLRDLRDGDVHSPAVVFITGFSSYQDEVLYDQGASGVLKKPIDEDELYRMILDQYYCDVLGKIFFQTQDQGNKNSFPMLNESDFELGNLGSGGAFLVVPKESLISHSHWKLGSRFQMTFPMGDSQRKVTSLAEVVWKRVDSSDGLKNGVGVRFIDLSLYTRNQLLDFVRAKDIRSYIPMGSPSGLGASA